LVKEKKEKKLKRCEKSHVPRPPTHPRCTTPTKVVMWGGVPDVVNHAKFRQNQFRGLPPWGSKSAIFLCLAAYITG